MLKSCKAVILAGGLGTRLHPFTQVIPKPLLPIGESSVLELQILSLRQFGITEIIIATNHMSDYVKAFLGDGSRYRVSISFSQEEKPLGTCGPLSLLRPPRTRSMSSGGGSEPYGRFVDLRLLAMVYILP